MEKEIFERSLRAFVRQKPFRRFVLELSSGSKIQVDHPEAVVTRNGVGVYFATDGEITLFDHQNVTKVFSEVPANASQ